MCQPSEERGALEMGNQLKDDKNKDAREVLDYDYKQLAHECDKHMELQIASDRDLVNCYKSLQKLNKDCEKLR
jgi:hypothetical protein